MIERYLAGIAALFFCGVTPALADDTCHLRLVTSLAMGIDSSGGVYVPMTIGGQQIKLLIDTAGIDSMLTANTVKALGLPTAPLTSGNYVTMFGGARIDHYATGRDVVLGTLNAPQMRFLVMTGGFMAPDLDGTLAPDVLRVYDDDFDFANAKFNLISPDHCRGKVVYWTNDAPAQIEFKLDDNNHVTFPVQLDGKQITVEMDTGSSRSVFSLEEAERLFGLNAASPGLTPLKEDGLEGSFKYPFKTMTFGGVSVVNPDIMLVPDSVSRMHASSDHIVLGMGILRQLHLYIAYHEKELYVTPATAH